MKIAKSAGPNNFGTLEGHCYDGTGWVLCDFWYGHKTKDNSNGDGVSRCMLFGVKDGVPKEASHALKCCDKIYGVDYQGNP